MEAPEAEPVDKRREIVAYGSGWRVRVDCYGARPSAQVIDDAAIAISERGDLVLPARAASRRGVYEHDGLGAITRVGVLEPQARAGDVQIGHARSILGRHVFARLGFTLGEEHFSVEATLPDAAEATPEALLPAAFELVAPIVTRGVEQAEGEVSCRRGCGACCRQVVPISQPEARHLASVLERLPEPRRSDVRQRFAAAVRRLDESGLRRRLQWPAQLSDAERQSLAADYFRLGIACPFLENEECSIHPERPLVCREYLVTTPAAHCAVPGQAEVRRVGIAGRVSVAMGQMEPQTAERGVWWMPLVLALEWCGANASYRPPRRNPVEMLRELAEWLRRTAS